MIMQCVLPNRPKNQTCEKTLKECIQNNELKRHSCVMLNDRNQQKNILKVIRNTVNNFVAKNFDYDTSLEKIIQELEIEN